MSAAVVLFTRDLRVHDHPGLARAAERHEAVVPLFVLDDEILGSDFSAPNRLAFLLDSLQDLSRSLGRLGAPLVVRRGDVVEETARVAEAVGATHVYVSSDASAYAQRREAGLCAAGRWELCATPNVTVAPLGAVRTEAGRHYEVFTPYWRRWSALPRRAVLQPPARLRPAGGLVTGAIPALADLVAGATSAELPRGGEREGRARMAGWLDRGLGTYARDRELLDAGGSSRLSPYLHFGCISPLELAAEASARAGGEPFVRQLCWRDFYADLLHARPGLSRRDLHPRGDEWSPGGELFAAWREGRTGYPVVDAGMRQLAREGWMHNRARLITASFACKHLYVDWRAGAAHFFALLVDGDLASNVGNWQWVAGTGVDARPHRVYNPMLQAERHDPRGAYVRRYVPELAHIAGPAVHQPWRLSGTLLAPDYPAPVVEHRQAVERFRAARRAASTAAAGVAA